MKDDLQQPTTQGQSEKVPFGDTQHSLSNINPTSAEINHLWSTYFAESLSKTMLKHMVAKSKDPDFHNVLKSALDLSSQNILLMKDLFNKIEHPIPDAFGENDVNVNAPALFDEAFMVRYTRLMTKFILSNYSMAFGESTRSDFRELFLGFINGSAGIINRADDVLLAKGLLPRSPYITFPDRVEYVEDKSYYGSFFGIKRPLNVLEISNIFAIMDFKIAIKALILGFTQVIKSDKLRKHLIERLEILDTHLDVLGSFLNDEGLPSPELLDYQVTDSTESPYSDRIMLFHVAVTMAYNLSVIGYGLSRVVRKDIALTYSRLIAEIVTSSKSSADSLIENGWLEKAPEAANRQELTH